VILTKLPHACFRLEKDGATLVVDPGMLSDPAAALAGADGVLITHEHPDHLDADAVRASGLPVWAPPGVADVTPLRPGDTADVLGFQVQVHGGRHAHIHEDVPDLANNGYLIDGKVYYPGDSFDVPGVPVDVLLVPIGGPWLKIAEAIDFVRAVRPGQAHPTHDAVLTTPGQQFSDTWVAQRGNAPYSRLTAPLDL
jgi:L-ascorbate metabolism protein UlaG (beta-lactamase superfamily)